MPEYSIALFLYIKTEIHRIHYNIRKEAWLEDKVDFNKTIIWRPYNDENNILPNFEYKGVNIWLGKHATKNLESNVNDNASSDFWVNWFDSCLCYLKKFDDKGFNPRIKNDILEHKFNKINNN